MPSALLATADPITEHNTVMRPTPPRLLFRQFRPKGHQLGSDIYRRP